MPRKPKYPVHKMGKYCGYDEFEDGSIKVASMYSDRFDEALESERAVNDLIRNVVKQCYELFRPISSAKRAFWKSIAEEYGLNYEEFDWSYEGKGFVRKSPKKAKDENNAA